MHVQARIVPVGRRQLVEIVHDRETGLLVAPANGAELAGALSGLIGDPGLRERLGAAAREWVKAHASLAAMRETYNDFYRTALVSRAP